MLLATIYVPTRVRRLLAALVICAGWSRLPIHDGHSRPLRVQQTSTCIGVGDEDSIGVYLINRVATFTVNPDSAFNDDRILYGLPLVSAGQISLITDERTCGKAATAYDAALTGKGSGLNGRVLVAKVGTGNTLRYVVLDPYFAYDSTAKSYVHLVMDSNFSVLHTFP